MVSWIAQDSEGLLAIDHWAVLLISVLATGLAGLAVFGALRRPWPKGSMKLTLGMSKLMFVTMLCVTGAWVVFALVYARTEIGQALYGLCAVLSGWSAATIFVALARD